MLRKILRLLFYKPPVRDCVGYSLRAANGKRLYTGITNNPRAREAEHRLDGKRFAYLQVETKLMSRDYAEEWERNSLEGYIERVGRLPKYNKTATGQYEVSKPPCPNTRR